jgi:DNA-binding CsgD family transcriptional regulator
MLRLGRSDLDASLRFAASAAELAASEGLELSAASDGPYPITILEGIRALVPALAIAYQDIDLRALRFDESAWLGPDDDEDDDLYFALGGCPISEYRERTGDLSAVRISDVMGVRSYRESEIYREYFRPAGYEHLADLGLPTTPGRHRSMILFREPGDRDFSERDRLVLELLRPHLLAFESTIELRRRLRKALEARAVEAGPTPRQMPFAGEVGLTAREREIVSLVAQGKTNAQIAAELWVAPSTVKKHLENVYVKLGIGRRAAAVHLLETAN